MTRNRRLWVVVLIALSFALPFVFGACAPAPTPAPPLSAEPAGQSVQEPAPTAEGQLTLTVWHRWPEPFAGTVRGIVDDYEAANPQVQVELVSKPALFEGLAEAEEKGNGPDVIALAGDDLAAAVEKGWVLPIESWLDPLMLEETYYPVALQALKSHGHLWGLPLVMHTLTFIYNMDLIGEAELAAETNAILTQARAYQAAHDGIWYLAYPARDDFYFAAPWFYGAGAWYVREDGSVGLDTPAGRDAAAFIASLREIMPEDIDFTSADALFKAGQAAMTMNGIWYLAELDAAGVRYGLQIMPIVSTSGRPARPLVAVDALMLSAGSAHAEQAVRLMAYLTNAESALRLARAQGVVPANRLAVERAGQESLWAVAHFAHQAELGEPVPLTPYWPASWEPVRDLLADLWSGTPPEEALRAAQERILSAMDAMPLP